MNASHVFNAIKTSGFELEISRFVFQLEALDTLIFPRENKGNVLRGAFGTIFKRICCGPVCTRCAESPLRDYCAYAGIFEPSPPPGSDRLRNLQDIPRPFVFRPPSDGKDRYAGGEVFEFDLLLFGRAQEFLAYFIVAFRELGEAGFGIGRGRCRLKQVVSLAADGCEVAIYSRETQVVQAAPKGFAASRLMSRAADVSAVRIDYLTPAEIKFDGAAVRLPAFHHLIKRLRDRINALAWFYQGTVLDIDFAGFGKRAEAIQTVQSKVAWTERERLSTRTRHRHSIGGFVGQVEYEGDLTEFIPYLRVGEWTHVGKHAVWGNGQYRIVTLA